MELQIEHHHSAGSAILPEISLVILALVSFGLHGDGCFIGLNVTTAQKFPTHCPNRWARVSTSCSRLKRLSRSNSKEISGSDFIASSELALKTVLVINK
jgi:hypothetical protein